jgi:hypothetical protein
MGVSVGASGTTTSAAGGGRSVRPRSARLPAQPPSLTPRPPPLLPFLLHIPLPYHRGHAPASRPAPCASARPRRAPPHTLPPSSTVRVACARALMGATRARAPQRQASKERERRSQFDAEVPAPGPGAREPRPRPGR